MKTVLAGTDFSASSLNACKYAALVAQQLKAKLVVFNLYHTPVYHANVGLMGISLPNLKAENMDRLTQLINGLKQDFPKLKMSALTGPGAFTNEIEQFVAHHQVAAVVMGLEAKARISKFIWGSHGVSIGGKINAPVIIVPDTYKNHQLKSVLLAIDNREKFRAGSPKEIETITKAAKLNLNLLHVRTPDELLNLSPIKGIKIGKVNRVINVQEAKTIEEGIRNYSRKNSVDLVTVVSRKHSVFYNLFSESVTKRVAFTSKVPVMALHE